jgi:hypothetical protein
MENPQTANILRSVIGVLNVGSAVSTRVWCGVGAQRSIIGFLVSIWQVQFPVVFVHRESQDGLGLRGRD